MSRRFNNFKKACRRYLLTICKTPFLINRAQLSIDAVDLLEDKVLFEFIMQIELDTLYKNPEFNRQLRIRMKFHNLKWINKNDS